MKEGECDGGDGVPESEAFSLVSGGSTNLNAAEILKTHRASIQNLEEELENMAYIWDEAEGKYYYENADVLDDGPGNIGGSKDNGGIRDDPIAVTKILSSISKHYEQIASLVAQLQHQNILKFSVEDVAEAYLDWAIASKRSNAIDDCMQAHAHRMKLCPHLKETDGVRLLGLKHNIDWESNSQLHEQNAKVSEITCRGIFESELIQKEPKFSSEEATKKTNEDDDGGLYYYVHRPTESAIEIGRKVCKIFIEKGYSLESCSAILHGIMENDCELFDRHRIYSANSFFNHRHDVRDAICAKGISSGSGDVDILAMLFLFGISLEKEYVNRVLSEDIVDVLMESQLLTVCPIDVNLLVGEVQIYPINLQMFEDDKNTDTHMGAMYFMTDWPLESLRLPRNAIMPVGYDSLELIALTSGRDLFDRSSSPSSSSSSRVLDLCTGCGIQGIFAAKRSLLSRNTNIVNNHNSELVCMDLNERACHFVTGNTCLNDLDPRSVSSHSSIAVFAVEANLFRPLNCNYTHGTKFNNSTAIGTFDHIVSNPPFVAVPFARHGSLCPALYSAGGDFDGMGLLRKILLDLFRVLRMNTTFSCPTFSSTNPTLFMVTEIPNVEDGCLLLEHFLQTEIDTSIKVAYIEDDVETMEEYAREREEEAGCQISGRDWIPSEKIRNRALVLITICQYYKKNANASSASKGLYCLKSETCGDRTDSYNADEEDLFLTRRGIDFARHHLL